MLISSLPSQTGPQYQTCSRSSPLSVSLYLFYWILRLSDFFFNPVLAFILSLQLILPVQPTLFFFFIFPFPSPTTPYSFPRLLFPQFSVHPFEIEVYQALPVWFMVWAAFIVTQSQAVSDAFTWEAVTHPAALWSLRVARPQTHPKGNGIAVCSLLTERVRHPHAVMVIPNLGPTPRTWLQTKITNT